MTDTGFIQRVAHLVAHLATFDGYVPVEIRLACDDTGMAYVQLSFNGPDDVWSLPVEDARLIAHTFLVAKDGGMEHGIPELGQHISDAVAHYDEHCLGLASGQIN